MTSAADGRLVLVGTPIGNLEDLSPRAVKALGAADVIFCEDTRRTRALLSAMHIRAPRLVRLDQHNEERLTQPVTDAVAGGEISVLVSDAGMPTISDPGFKVVSAVAAAGLKVEVIPGPSAVSAALALSGLPASEYRFVGFLPRKGRDRVASLDALSRERVTTVIYEAPYRIARTIGDLAEACGGDRVMAAAREITKIHEEVWRGSMADAVAWLSGADSPPRGEWVIVVAGAGRPVGGPTEVTRDAIAEALGERLAGGSDRRQAIAEVTARLSVPRKQVYEVAVSLKDLGPE